MYHWTPHETCLYNEISNYFIPEICQLILDYCQTLGDQLHDRKRITHQIYLEEAMRQHIAFAKAEFPKIDQAVQVWIKKNRSHLLHVALQDKHEEYYEACKMMIELKVTPYKEYFDPNQAQFLKEWTACRWFFLEQGLHVFNPLYHDADYFNDRHTRCYCDGSNHCERSNLIVCRITPLDWTVFRYKLLPESHPELDEPMIQHQYFDFESRFRSDRERLKIYSEPLYQSYTKFLEHPSL